MVYTTALDKFTALTQRATAEAVAAAPAGPTESIPACGHQQGGVEVLDGRSDFQEQ